MSIEPTCYYCNQSFKGRCQNQEMAIKCFDYPPNVEKRLIDNRNNLINKVMSELKSHFSGHGCISNENDFRTIAKLFIKKFNIK